MFSAKSIKMVEDAVKEETINARRIYGNCYNSKHEGYAVTEEEVEETLFNAHAMENFSKNFWNDVKNDNDIMPSVQSLYNAALYTALEAIQVCACCNKMMGKEV